MTRRYRGDEGQGVRRLSMAAVTIILCAFFLLPVGCEKKQADSEAAPLFTLTTFTNTVFSLEEARGSVVVVNFWASWCGPCELEAPELEAVWLAFKGRGVKFIGVALQDTEVKARAFVEEQGLTFPIGMDSDGSLMEAYHIYGIPRTLVIDRDGMVLYEHTGVITEDVLSGVLEKALSNPQHS